MSKSFRVSVLRSMHRFGSTFYQLLILAREDLMRREARQAAVMMLAVISVNIVFTPALGMVITIKAPGVVWLVF